MVLRLSALSCQSYYYDSPKRTRNKRSLRALVFHLRFLPTTQVSLPKSDQSSYLLWTMRQPRRRTQTERAHPSVRFSRRPARFTGRLCGASVRWRRLLVRFDGHGTNPTVAVRVLWEPLHHVLDLGDRTSEKPLRFRVAEYTLLQQIL